MAEAVPDGVIRRTVTISSAGGSGRNRLRHHTISPKWPHYELGLVSVATRWRVAMSQR